MKAQNELAASNGQYNQKSCLYEIAAVLFLLLVGMLLVFSYFYYVIFGWKSGDASGHVVGMVMPLSEHISDVHYFKSYYEEVFNGKICLNDAIEFSKKKYGITPQIIENKKKCEF